MSDLYTDRLSDRDAKYVLHVRHGTFSIMPWFGWLFTMGAGTSVALGAIALLLDSVAPQLRPPGWTVERTVAGTGIALLFLWLGLLMLDVARCHRIIAAMAADGASLADRDQQVSRARHPGSS